MVVFRINKNRTVAQVIVGKGELLSEGMVFQLPLSMVSKMISGGYDKPFFVLTKLPVCAPEKFPASSVFDGQGLVVAELNGRDAFDKKVLEARSLSKNYNGEVKPW